MDEQTNLKTISIKELWDVFVKCFWIMVLAAIVAAGAFFAFNKITYVPMYSSKATLYVLNDSENVSSSDLTTADKFLPDCTHVIKSHTVLDSVISEFSLDMTYDELKEKVSTHNPTDTRFVEITVEASSPEEAKAMVDAICEISCERIMEKTGYKVNVFEHGIFNSEPSNARSLMIYILVAMVAAIAVYGVFLVMYILDDSIWTDEEVERYLGLSVIGDIPDANSTQRKGYGKYGKYGKYGRYGQVSNYSADGYGDNEIKSSADNSKGGNK
jgi:capsular polysaccharide biosynthesis protein